MFQKKTENDESYVKNNFMPLDELVYAPLRALAYSSRELQSQVTDAIKSMGTVRQKGAEEIIELKNLNIAYEQIRSETDEDYCVDNLQLKLPLLSVVPLSNLNIDKADIDFSVEVQMGQGQEDKCQLLARICSPNMRDSDLLPKVSYKLKVESLPATEGILRLNDLLSNNQVAKQMDTTPINTKGNLGNEKHKEMWLRCNHLRNKIQKLKELYRKVSDMMSEQERMRQISQSAFEENVYDFDEDKYHMVQGNIANRIMKYQTEIMDLEITYGLEQDYE